MAKKQDRKKQKQRLRDKKRQARQRAYLARQRRANYPDIIVSKNLHNPAFGKAVWELVNTFSYNDDSHCPPDIREHYQAVAHLGWPNWYAQMRAWAYEQEEDSAAANQLLQRSTVPTMLHFGTWLHERLPARYTTRFSPDHFFRVNNYKTTNVVTFRLMANAVENGQKLYTPPRKPTVRMQGVDWRIALYEHALDRLCARLVPSHSLNYSHYLDIHLGFEQGRLNYTPITLADGAEAARVDIEYPLGTVFLAHQTAWARAILGLPTTHDFAKDTNYRLVLGYLPLHIQGKFARAKTFLLPGFAKTPEHTLAIREAKSDEERRMLRAMTDEHSRTNDLDGDTVAAIKWYHDHGVPQIYRTP